MDSRPPLPPAIPEQGPRITCNHCGRETALVKAIGPPGFRTLRCDGCSRILVSRSLAVS